MARPESPHDKLFGEAFGSIEAMRGLLQSTLPKALLAKLDLSALRPVPGSCIDEGLAGSRSDLLFSVKFAGRPALIYVLIEHKSWVDRWVALQLLRYIIRIWERVLADEPRLARLPPIIPLVVYHGESGWTAPRGLWELLDVAVREEPALARLTPSFEFLVDDLTQATDEQIFSRAMGLFAGIAAVFLRDARTPARVVPMLRRLGTMLRELWRAPNGRRAVTILLRYIWVVADVSQEEVAAVVENNLPEARELIMTIAERLRQEGLEQGLERGREEGMRTGMLGGRIRIVRRQLELRFGALGEAVVQRLESSDEAALERFAERLLTARTVEEVFGS